MKKAFYSAACALGLLAGSGAQAQSWQSMMNVANTINMTTAIQNMNDAPGSAASAPVVIQYIDPAKFNEVWTKVSEAVVDPSKGPNDIRAVMEGMNFLPFRQEDADFIPGARQALPQGNSVELMAKAQGLRGEAYAEAVRQHNKRLDTIIYTCCFLLIAASLAVMPWGSLRRPKSPSP